MRLARMLGSVPGQVCDGCMLLCESVLMHLR